MNNLIFLYGLDSYRSLRALNAVKTRYLEKHPGLAPVELDGERVSPNELIEACAASSLFAKKQLIVLRHLLASKNAAAQEALMSVIASLAQDSLLVVYESNQPDARSKVFQRLKKDARTTEFNRLEGAPLKRFIEQLVKNLGAQIAPNAVNKLAEHIGGDLWRVQNEIEKLACFSQKITDEGIELLLNLSSSTAVFGLTDEIMLGRKKSALLTLDELIRQGEPPLRLLGLIASAYRSLTALSLAQDQRTASWDKLAKKLKIHPYVARKLAPIAKKSSQKKLAQSLFSILHFDAAIKRGKIEESVALDLLILKL